VEKVPGIDAVTFGMVVVSVTLTLVYVTSAVACLWPGGQEKVEGGGGGESVSDAVTFPFLPELNVPVALTGPLTVVLFEALGLAPPLLTQTYVAVASAFAV
jgi:hypothetical protein